MAQQGTGPSANDINQLFYIYQVLEDQQKMLMEQLDMLNGQIRGVSLSKMTMEGLKEQDLENEILLPIGSNAFIKAKLIEPERVVVTISNDMLIEKKLEDGIISMEKLLQNYETIHSRLNNQLSDVSSKLDEMRPQLEQIYRSSGINRQ